MPKIDDCGPAFPVPGLQADADFNGLSKRDYFAATIRMGSDDMDTELAQLLMGSEAPRCNALTREGFWLEHTKWWAEAHARLRYLRADAMLKARQS